LCSHMQPVGPGKHFSSPVHADRRSVTNQTSRLSTVAELLRFHRYTRIVCDNPELRQSSSSSTLLLPSLPQGGKFSFRHGSSATAALDVVCFSLSIVMVTAMLGVRPKHRETTFEVISGTSGFLIATSRSQYKPFTISGVALPFCKT
jgi:hypothetical protein